MTEEEILSIQPCNCGRPWCQFFSGAIGEDGTSFSREEIEEMISEKSQKHLKKLLKTSEPNNH